MHKLSQVAARIVGEELGHGRGTVCVVASKYNLAILSFNSASVTAKSFLTIVPSVNLRQPERNFKIFRSVTGHALEKKTKKAKLIPQTATFFTKPVFFFHWFGRISSVSKPAKKISDSR